MLLMKLFEGTSTTLESLDKEYKDFKKNKHTTIVDFSPQELAQM
jgi:hypothetical protein